MVRVLIIVTGEEYSPLLWLSDCMSGVAFLAVTEGGEVSLPFVSTGGRVSRLSASGMDLKMKAAFLAKCLSAPGDPPVVGIFLIVTGSGSCALETGKSICCSFV